jgi:PST family polysaccharide transporter
MSLAHKAARGAVWTIITSIGGRAIGVLGTLVMTRFLSPDIIGEVSDAAILCFTMGWVTNWGFGQYAVIRGRGEDMAEVTWHAVVAYLGLGAIGLGAMAALGGHLTPLLDAPHAAVYVPGMALAIFIKRFAFIPERVLLRRMQFRASGLSLFLGEASYTVAALAFAYSGYGGMSVVYANIVQSTIVVVITLRASGIKSWATPTKLRWSRFRDMTIFGVPLMIQGVAHGASRYWDNLTVSRMFGPAATGTYNMAYNLADIPAIQVGEQIALVLLPSMAELPPEARPRAVERSSALLSLILFPLAVGLGLVAYPLIGLLLPSDKWQEVAPLLTVLTSLSVFRPFVFVLSTYMEAEGKTGRLMWLEIGKLGVLIGGIVALSPLGLRVAAGAVGLSFGAAAIAAGIVVSREGVSMRALFIGFVQPLLACGAMAAAIAGVHFGLRAAGLAYAAVELVTEIVVGAIAYVVAVLIVAPTSSRDLLRLLKKTLRRGKET